MVFYMKLDMRHHNIYIQHSLFLKKKTQVVMHCSMLIDMAEI